MAFGDLLDRMLGRTPTPEQERMVLPPPPTAQDVFEALDQTEQLLGSSALPSVVVARAQRVIDTARDTVPRLEKISGSQLGYTVMATATDYLPEAIGSYQRLPRRYADTRPVDGAKTSLMVLVDQLDLLGLTMDRVFDAVFRDDARELVAQGRFIAEKFGSAGAGGTLRVEEGTPVPQMPSADDATGSISPLTPPAQGDS
ncbi:hypothetical protein ACQBAT_05360 [Ornithinimicrobium sp. Y1847]|uniref:hypothetical protein n=1 Tax=unclassified Ornithinimicrobium TaxID=2615080 RepID=UPI003B6807EB